EPPDEIVRRDRGRGVADDGLERRSEGCAWPGVSATEDSVELDLEAARAPVSHELDVTSNLGGRRAGTTAITPRPRRHDRRDRLHPGDVAVGDVTDPSA